jgi:signal transduction histidine kinase
MRVPAVSGVEGEMIMAVALDVPVSAAAQPRPRSLAAGLMTGGFVLYTLLILAGHLVGFPLAYAYLHTVCASGCALKPGSVRALEQVGLSVAFYADLSMALQVLYILATVGGASLMVFKKPGQWVPLGLSCFLVGLSAFHATDYPALTAAYPILAVPVQLLLGVGMGVLGMYALLTFPNGRFGRRWLLGFYLASLVEGVLSLFITNPIFVTFDNGWNVLSFPLILLILIYRYRCLLNVRERIATKWLILCWSVFIPSYHLFMWVLPAIVPPDSPAFLAINTFGAFGCGINIAGFLMATLYANAFDIDVIFSRTLIYAALTAIVVGLYIVVVGYLGALFRTEGNLVISLVATGVVAVLFQPVRGWLQQAINHLFFGERDAPYQVLSRLDRQMAQAMPLEDVLPALVRTIANTLKLPYAAVTLAHSDGTAPAEERLVAMHGQLIPPTCTQSLPVFYQGETVGQLVLAPRAGEAQVTRADRRLLEDLAQHAGVIAHAVRLTTDLRRSRERIVVAREEERRRLRRDLHDGLGPMLASLTLTLAAAREYLPHDPTTTDSLLQALAAQVQGAVTDIRRLVYELRPPALDDLGLLGALREQAARSAHGALQVCVEAPVPVDPLPAAVEVAAYRIAVEALTNVVRHAHARTCAITVRREDDLVIKIADDGRGIPAEASRGIGLRSMRERAEELGGSCTIVSSPGEGTHVIVCFPITEDADGKAQ